MFSNILPHIYSPSIISKLQNVINLLLDFDRTVKLMLGFDRYSAALATAVLTSSNASRLGWNIMLVDDLDADEDEPDYSYQFDEDAMCIAIFHDNILDSFRNLFQVAALSIRQRIVIITDDPQLTFDDFLSYFEMYRENIYMLTSIVFLHILQTSTEELVRMTFYRMALLNIGADQLQVIDAINELQNRHEMFAHLFAAIDTVDLNGATLLIKSELEPPNLLLTNVDSARSSHSPDDVVVTGNQVELLYLVGRYLNASVKFVERRMSKSARTRLRGLTEYYTKYREKVYRTSAIWIKVPLISTPYL